MATTSNHPETCWCYGTGWRVELGRKCALPNEDPLLTQCTETESGGVRCEAWLTSPDEPHNHFITRITQLRRC